jgi:hypothetical protein
MVKTKKIPCRVCGKLFEPCATCQSHNDMFRWRNFACSRDCAEKYISETIAYRNSLKEDKNNGNSIIEEVSSIAEIDTNIDSNANSDNSHITKRKYNKKKSTNDVEIINEEREQID